MIGLLFIVLILVFIYAPIVILAFYSFTNASQIGAFQSFSLQNYVTLFSTEELREMIFGTIALAVGVAAVSTLLGTLGAIGSFYSGNRVNGLYDTCHQCGRRDRFLGMHPSGCRAGDQQGDVYSPCTW